MSALPENIRTFVTADESRRGMFPPCGNEACVFVS